MTKKKLLFIMPSIHGGGAERILTNLLNFLDYDFYSVDIIVLFRKGDLWEDLPKEVNKKYVRFHPLLIKGLSLFLRKTNINLFSFLGYSFRGRYDVGISFMDSIFTELLFLESLKLDKKVAVIHSSYKSYINKSKFIKGNYKTTILKRYKKLDNIICVSNESKEEFQELFGSDHQVDVIYNPLNINDVLEKSTKCIPRELKSDVFQFVALGSLIPVKGFDLLIRSVLLLKESGYKFHLHILGEGFLRKRLHDQIEGSDLRNFITLQGFKKNPYPWIKNAHVLVMSSIAEGLPTVLCEGLILGKPVIVPNVPGCREVIGYGKYGIMCERDENEYFQVMARCITDPSYVNMYKEKAIERKKIFSDEVALEKYNKIFQS